MVAAATAFVLVCTFAAAGAAVVTHPDARGTETPRDILSLLERDVAGIVSPWLAGRRGSFYMGGQSLAQTSPLTTLWNVRENETLGFMHPYFRDGRARGTAITCDELTGCGHDLHGWEFYRDTRVLNGSVTVDGARTYVNPSPSSLIWRPDRLTAHYHIEDGVELEEVKFFTNDDVLIDIITLLPSGDGDDDAPASVKLSFDGVSYVNTEQIPPAGRDPSSKGLPPTTQRSVKRNSTAEVDVSFPAYGCGGTPGRFERKNAARCGAIHVEEHGTAYAKPIDCKFAPFPPGVDCLLKEGPMMYDGQSVFIAASTDILSSATVSRDADRRATYSFSVQLTRSTTPLVLGWVQGDDTAEARKRIAAYMSPSAATRALAARSAAANEFLSSKVPQLNVSLRLPTSGGVDLIDDFNTITWDEHKEATCHNSNTNKYKFLHNASTLAACEAVCGADSECQQLEFQHTLPQWCALYNTSTVVGKAIPGSKFDCVCKGPCPNSPSPSPHPGPNPSPVPLMNRTLDFNVSQEQPTVLSFLPCFCTRTFYVCLLRTRTEAAPKPDLSV
jgi:hypothetical protein